MTIDNQLGYLDNELPAPVALGQPGREFLGRVRRAATNVLADSPTGREVLELCDDHDEARRMVLEDRSSGMNVIAVVGATGQGKSWLIRQLIHDPSVSNAIRSGNNASEATERLIWVGPKPPADLDSNHEQYIHCKNASMQSIGSGYLLVDAPGATDDRRAIAAVAARALSLASVLLVVVRRDQLRSEVIASLAEASEGTIVIPIVNAVRSHDDQLDTDVEAFVARMRQAAPTSMIVSPVIIDDFEVDGRSEQSIGKIAAEDVATNLQSELGNSWEGDRRRSTRLAALDARFRAALHSVLSDQLPGLTGAVRRLNNEARELPIEVAESLVGSGGPLRAAVRSRLRLALLTDTDAIWFPYRSILGILNLTHGAWDRVLMSLSGSLPSLVSAVWSTTKNLTAARGAEEDIRDGLQRRSAAAVTDRLGPLAARFRDELAELRNEKQAGGKSIAGDRPHSQVAFLSGIDTLQETSARIFDEEVDRVATNRAPALLFGLIGMLIFWFLMAGPIVALYRGYFDASYATLSEFAGDLDRFPRPDMSMMLTSFMLSLLPTAFFAMIVLSLAQGRSRVDRVERRIRERHHESINRLQEDGVLQLRWDEPLLADAEFLLSAGIAEPES
ncbi:MAG: hypothetical protein AB8B91_09255 [Rubripirellula sp.]